LSLPLPVGLTPLKGEKIAHYFDNLLPDSELIRRRIARRFGTDEAMPRD
jgi:serine/threonine-protein kinase HipA